MICGPKTAALGALAGTVGAAFAQANPGDVIFTEFFSSTNQAPSQNERVQEFVELFNTTGAAIDVSGWTIADDGVSDPFPAGTIIPAGGTLVVTGDDGNPDNDVEDFGNGVTAEGYNRITEAQFDAAWGSGINRIVLDNFESLSNSPNLVDNEILELRDDSGFIIDVLNYDDAFPWPIDSPQGTSVSLLPFFLNDFDNDQGQAWRRTDADPSFGGFFSNELTIADSNGDQVLYFPGTNFASPGFVNTTIPPLTDCNNNGVDDVLDIFNFTSDDCNTNGIPDECETDCDNNGIVDECDIAADPNIDCNLNGIPDSCDIAANPNLDLNNDGVIDACAAAGDVIITEIMFNPASPENASEWVEILNVSGSTIDLSGWRIGDLEDLDPATLTPPQLTTGIPNGVSIAPGEVVVLIPDFTSSNQDPADAFFGLDPVTEFLVGWPDTPPGTQIFALDVWEQRANNGSPGDEILALVDAAGVASDVVDYDADFTPGAGWPGDDGTGSYYLIGSRLNSQDNNNGPSWRLSIDGIASATSASGLSLVHNTVRTQGSPGVVDSADPVSPASDVIITEIHAVSNAAPVDAGFVDENGDPVLFALPNEFVEITNVGAAPIDLSGWYLRDEDGYSATIPGGTMLAPNTAAILYQGEIGAVDSVSGIPATENYQPPASESEQNFYDAWGCGYQVIALTGWTLDLDRLPNSNSLLSLSNGPGIANEVLTLRRADGTLADLVNFDDDGIVWPADGTGDPALTGFSIYLLPGAYNAVDNDSGFNWAANFIGFDSARMNTLTDVFNADMDASPGAVEGLVTPDLADCVCLPDLNGDGVVDNGDIGVFVQLFLAQDSAADFNGDGFVDNGDIGAFVAAFLAGCP